ncbi:hypothetical protein VTN96DRAFT_5576 [Rasamsonia emersonii]
MASSQATKYLIEKHPLQRLPSPSRGISALVHLTGLSSFFWTFKYLIDNPNYASDAYGWHFQFLTIIGLSLATVTFAAALLADLTLSRRLFLFKNLLSVCSAPLEVLISILYWGLKFIDESLVVPEEETIPLHADINFHAIPAIVLLVDLLFLSPPWTITALPALALSTVFAFGYWFWIEKCYEHNGWYPYPIFELLPTPGRIGLFALSAVIMTLNTVTLKWLYGRLNGFGREAAPQARPGDVKKDDLH